MELTSECTVTSLIPHDTVATSPDEETGKPLVSVIVHLLLCVMPTYLCALLQVVVISMKMVERRAQIPKPD